MELTGNYKRDSFLRIGIIGAGFSGTALAGTLHRLSRFPVEIILFEKTGAFGTGLAYSTSFPFHLLNVSACEMSAFSDEPDHFVKWLYANPNAHAYLDQHYPYDGQFAPRFLYGDYLKALLDSIQSDPSQKIKLTLVSSEVVDVIQEQGKARIISECGKEIMVDKVVLALGNDQPADFSFPVSKTNCITNPWHYTAINAIAKDEPVLIVGMGLSMIDTVLTLHHQKHQGMIYAISRHGLLPLSHADTSIPYHLRQERLPKDVRGLTKYLRAVSLQHIENGGDWRAIINALRVKLQAVWVSSSLTDKRRFLRHVLPYWNIHRHRVHNKIANLLSELSQHQLKTLSGRVISVENNMAQIQLRHSHEMVNIKIKWLINCMGPSLHMPQGKKSLNQSLIKRKLAIMDPLNVGLSVALSGALKDGFGNDSTWLYTLGPPAKAAFWECGAVPEIRKQSLNLAKHLLNIHEA